MSVCVVKFAEDLASHGKPNCLSTKHTDKTRS
ncbi:hypothetical protein ACB092_07G095000 [Castanea dentata]